MVGREFHEMPDREYGALMAEAYARAARSEGVHVQAVRALIGTSAGVTLRTRYDRVLMPWRYKGGDVFVMCISLRRERPLPL